MRSLHIGRFGLWGSVVVVSWVLIFAGCDNSTFKPVEPPTNPGLEECGASNIFNKRNFSNPTQIDNQWLPLVPGTQFILDGEADRGGGLLPHRVVFTVTDLTKVIGGIRCVVLWDRDYNEGVLQEAELAFFAQDDAGNVWTMGEYPEEYEDGEFVGAPDTWFNGLQTAEAGINVPAQTEIGFHFLQGFVPDIDFLDCGMIYKTGVTTCVPYNCFEGVLEVDEWSPLEVGSGHQRKYYAAGLGLVRVGAVDDPEGETLVLTNVLQLNPRLMQQARQEAFKLEARAYDVSEVYRLTPPME